MGFKIKGLYLDREFFTVEVINYLQERNTPFIIPCVLRGRSGGIRNLFVGRKKLRRIKPPTGQHLDLHPNGHNSANHEEEAANHEPKPSKTMLRQITRNNRGKNSDSKTESPFKNPLTPSSNPQKTKEKS